MIEHLKRHALFFFFMMMSITWLIPAYEGLRITMSDKSQHMEYVWLIPLLCLFLLWQKRHAILEQIAHPKPALGTALPLFLLAAPFLFFGLRGSQTRFLQIAAILLLLAIPLACYGRKLFKTVWFPILLLAFVIPVGFLDNFTVPMRRMSVTVTSFLLNGLGITVRQVGTAIVSTSSTPFQLDVADPCSGIRSLVALFVGTAAYGAISLHSIPKRWILFLASLPIAFLGNILRLLLTAFTCYWISQHAGMTLHDHALFIIAPVYTFAVIGLTDWLKRTDCKQVATEQPLETSDYATPKWKFVTLILLACALPAFHHYASQTPPLTFESDDFLEKQFKPLPNATMVFPWFCQNRACLYSQNEAPGVPLPKTCPRCNGDVSPVAKAELDILPSDTQSRKVTYTFVNGDEFTVSLVVAGENRMSIHRPELCLPSQGFSLSERIIFSVSDTLPMATFSLRSKGQTHATGFAYVFIHSKGATISNLERVVGDSLQRSLYNKIPRWAMLTVRSTSYDFHTPEGQQALQRFMTLLYPTLFTIPRE